MHHEGASTGSDMPNELEADFWRRQLKEIKSRLSRPVGLSAQERLSFKAELREIEKLIGAGSKA